MLQRGAVSCYYAPVNRGGRAAPISIAIPHCTLTRQHKNSPSNGAIPAGPAVCHRMWQQLLEDFGKALVVLPEESAPPRALHVGYQVKSIRAGLTLGTQMTTQYLRCQRTWLPKEEKSQTDPRLFLYILQPGAPRRKVSFAPLAGECRESPNAETSHRQTAANCRLIGKSSQLEVRSQ